MPKKSKKARRRGNSEEGNFPKGTLSVEEFLQWAGIGRNLFYEEIRKQRIHARKCGTRTVVPIEEAERWLRELPVAGAPAEDKSGDVS